MHFEANKLPRSGSVTVAQKNIEEALEESESRYRELFENINIGIFMSTLEGVFLHVNPVVVSMAGYDSAEELMRLPAQKLYADLSERERLIRELSEQGKIKNAAVRSVKKDGTVYWISFSAVLLKDANGKPKSILGFVEDITARKNTEEALLASKEVLRESEEKYRNLFNNAEVGMFRTRLDGSEILDMNEKFLKIFGCSREEMQGRSSSIHWADQAEREQLIKKLKKDGRVTEFECRMLNRQGEVRHCLASLRLYTDQEILEGSIIDITDRKKAEEEKQRLEEKLHQSQKLEAIGTLAGGIAHDFNNILAIIIGNSELALYEASENASIAERLSNIVAASLRAKELIKQILNFSRQSQPEKTPVDIVAHVEEALKLIRASLPTSIKIVKTIHCRSSMILANATQLNQIILNLATNAAYAMDYSGDLRISLDRVVLHPNGNHLFKELAPKEYIVLAVADTGCGIKPEYLDRIFDPYFTTKEIGKGSGLGLAVVYGIVKSHGGTITVTSELGKGSTFRVYLPAAGSGEVDKIQTVDPIPQGHERILFVDDEEMLVELGSKLLISLGYHVVTKNNPLEALAFFRNHSDLIDLVITDMAMPDLPGNKLALELLKIRADIPILMCTGYSEILDEKSAKDMGIRKILIKPLTKKDLAESIRTVLEGGEMPLSTG